ncbi:GOLD domain-containing protein [Meloidogyne graminicola]|uniref:GOLD domain-containing protein n=1 Tax=Meloidogyne graminicola TaxID=189291 RepID=A0A8T0A0G0_9BILA|nr:GOLD domain-containing protein [Meloidogyne graminicola]
MCKLQLFNVQMYFFTLFLFSLIALLLKASELTFELDDNAEQCFYDELKKGIDSVLEYQVVTGGQYDVDVVLEDPNGNVLYKELKKQLDSYSYKTSVEGTYKVCFSNEFSTFSHKVVYMDWQVGEPEFKGMPIPRVGTSMTQMERSIGTLADRLKIVDDYQTHHRLREATGRKRAEDLNERVTYWSLGQTAVVVIIGVGQVLVLRSFFSDRKSVGI